MRIIRGALEWIFDGWGRLAMPLAVVAGLWVAWQADRAVQRHRGATNATTEIDRQATVLAGQAAAAAARVAEPGAAERLRQSRAHCGDC